MFWIVAFLVFMGVLLYIWPSGPECPECKKHYTEHFKFKHTNTEVTYCYLCRYLWDFMIDNKKVSKEEFEDYVRIFTDSSD